jgi:acyl-lipid omega-6 desaturase (Delta-12 desaturase)
VSLRDEAARADAARLVGLRRQLAALPTPRRAWAGAALVLVGLLLWALLFRQTALADSVLAKLAWGALNGVLIGLLFIAGHDASHGAASDHPALNRWLARLAFLPSWHTHFTWDRDHNRTHHNWTNLAGTDPGYAPLSPAQYRALPGWRRAWLRGTHNVAGMGFAYLAIWWRMTFSDPPEQRAEGSTRLQFVGELVGLALFGLGTAVVLHLIGTGGRAGLAGVAAEWLVAVGWPFIVFVWMMAFVTWPQHTQPQLRWYDRREEWTAWRGHVAGTAHVRWPGPLAWAFLQIFTHTAHHLDRRVPLYALARHQALIEFVAPAAVVRTSASWALWRDLFRTCRLYDYREHAWLDWDGRVLARPPAPA